MESACSGQQAVVATAPAAHIEVEDHDAAAAPPLRVPSSDGDRAEEAEAHRPLCLQRSCIAAGHECLVPRLHASALGTAHSMTASAARQTVSAGHSACKHAEVVRYSKARLAHTTAWCPGGLQMPKPDVLPLPGSPAADASMTASTSDMAAPDACQHGPAHPSATSRWCPRAAAVGRK